MRPSSMPLGKRTSSCSLLKKFPQAAEEDLSRAQAFAYGGAIIQDMGYYPYGSPFFQ